MLKSSKQSGDTEEIDWKKHLTPEEFKAAAEIKKIFPQLPPNVFVIPPESLSEMANND